MCYIEGLRSFISPSPLPPAGRREQAAVPGGQKLSSFPEWIWSPRITNTFLITGGRLVIRSTHVFISSQPRLLHFLKSIFRLPRSPFCMVAHRSDNKCGCVPYIIHTGSNEWRHRIYAKLLFTKAIYRLSAYFKRVANSLSLKPHISPDGQQNPIPSFRVDFRIAFKQGLTWSAQ